MTAPHAQSALYKAILPTQEASLNQAKVDITVTTATVLETADDIEIDYGKIMLVKILEERMSSKDKDIVKLIDYLLAIYSQKHYCYPQPIEIKSATFPPRDAGMEHVGVEPAEKDLPLVRISKIVDALVEKDEVFKELDKTKMMECLSTLMENPPPDLASITDDEFTHRIRKVMLVEVMSGMLNDLSPAQIESFDEAVKRRRFFG